MLWKWGCVGGRAVVMSSAQSVCSVLAWLCFPCPFFSWWRRTAGDTTVGNDAMEATTCCTCGCRRCWSQYYKPKPQALWHFTAYLCCAFFPLILSIFAGTWCDLVSTVWIRVKRLNVKAASHTCWFTARERTTAEMLYLTTNQTFIIVERMTWQAWSWTKMSRLYSTEGKSFINIWGMPLISLTVGRCVHFLNVHLI